MGCCTIVDDDDKEEEEEEEEKEDPLSFCHQAENFARSSYFALYKRHECGREYFCMVKRTSTKADCYKYQKPFWDASSSRLECCVYRQICFW